MAWLLTLTKLFMWLVSTIDFGLLMHLSVCKQTNDMQLTISQVNDLVYVKGHTIKRTLAADRITTTSLNNKNNLSGVTGHL